MRIIGAGLSGLIAAHAWPSIPVIEREPEPHEHHKALLRFRSEIVSNLVGIPFREVTVHKAIWNFGYHSPNLRLANQYSRKVLGKMHNDRSIWNLDPAQRWIAPEDLYSLLLNNVKDRIQWGQEAALQAGDIVTIPLPAILKQFDYEIERGTFTYAPIKVTRYRVPDSDVFQTIYFPDPYVALYRASITGDLLIAEAMDQPAARDWGTGMLRLAFGVPDLQLLEEAHQRYGKIAPIPNQVRRDLLFHLTQRHGIYCLGRFATWRNLLLDDIVHDITVIKSLMRSDSYAARIASLT